MMISNRARGYINKLEDEIDKLEKENFNLKLQIEDIQKKLDRYEIIEVSSE